MIGIIGAAVRRIRRRPATSILIVLVTAISIGVSTAIIAIADPVLLRPLPFSSPSQLVVLPFVRIPADYDSRPGVSTPAHIVSLDDVAQLKSVIRQSGAYIATSMNVGDSSHAEPITVGIVTPSLFRVLGVSAVVGRTFDASEGVPNGPAVALVARSFWSSHSGDRAILDSTILLNGHSYTVLGVLPTSFGFPDGSQVWIPLTVPVTAALLSHVRGSFAPTIVARLRDGVSLRRASEAVLLRWQQALMESTPGSPRYSNLAMRMDAIRGRGAALSLQSAIGGNTRPLVTALLVGVILIYLIVCANLTGILLADGLRRRREFMVHEALGERRPRTIQRLFVESLTACGLGTGVGILIAALLLGAFRALVPEGFAGLRTATMSFRVVSAAIGGAAVAGVVIRSAAATQTQVVRLTMPEMLRANPGAGPYHSSRTAIRRGLVTLQVALATTLLVGALLLAKSLHRLTTSPLGIVADSVVESWVSVRGDDEQSRYRRVLAVVDAIRHTSGITQAGAANQLPFSKLEPEQVVHTGVSGNDSLVARVTDISPGYVEALRIPIVAGRSFTHIDDASTARVALVSVSATRKVTSALEVGSLVRIQGDADPFTVVGIVGDVKDDGPTRPTVPHVYLPLALGLPRDVAVLARTTLPTPLGLTTLRGAVMNVNLGQEVFGLQTLDESLRAIFRPARIASFLSSALALFAVIMALIGVYGVITFDVESRYREFGVRAALGASSGMLIQAVGRGIVIAVSSGLLLGLLAAYALSRFLGSLLVGVSTHDLPSFAVALLSMLMVSACAVLIPGMRVLHVQPADIMRDT